MTGETPTVPDVYTPAAERLAALGYRGAALELACEALIFTGTAHQGDDGPFAGAFRPEDVDAVESLLPEHPSLDWHPHSVWAVAFSPVDMGMEV